jgi:SAM-dependent methyltransferase
MRTSNIQSIVSSVPKLHEIWATVIGGYPSNYQTLSIQKGRVMLRGLAYAQGLDVLEAGCNSGLYSIILSNYANSVTGVDFDDKNIERAVLSFEYAIKNNLCIDNIRFVHSDLISCLPSLQNVNCLVASLFLYYLKDDELVTLRDFIRQQVQTIIIQCRPDRHKLVFGKPEYGNVSNLSLYNGLYDLPDNINFVRDCGFPDITVLGLDLINEEVCPVLVAKRPA